MNSRSVTRALPVLVLVSGLVACTTPRDPQARPETLVPRAAPRPVLDGRLDDPIWQRATPLASFLGTMKGEPSPLVTTTQLAWDETALYLAIDCVDDFIATPYRNRDDSLWKADAFELFLDPGGDGRDYLELQVSPRGTIFDSRLPRHRRNDDRWTSGLEVHVALDGTLDLDTDQDRGWRAEIRLPMADLVAVGFRPRPGARLSANFFRVDLGRADRKRYAAWSAPLRGDFHALDRFGTLVLTD